MLRQPSRALLASWLPALAGGPLKQSSRGMYVMKRKYRQRQPNELEEHKNLNTKKAQTYEVAERTENIKREPLTVILKEFVEGIGDAGDVVSVKPGLARYGLLLPGLAEYATPEALERAEALRQQSVRKRTFSSLYAPITIRSLRTRLFGLDMSEKTPWRLEQWHIRATLRCHGVIVPESAIQLRQEPVEGPAKEVFNKDVIVKILVNGQDEALCRFRVRSAQRVNDPSLVLQEGDLPWYLDGAEALLESQRDQVADLHKACVDRYQLFQQRRTERGDGI